MKSKIMEKAGERCALLWLRRYLPFVHHGRRHTIHQQEASVSCQGEQTGNGLHWQLYASYLQACKLGGEDSKRVSGGSLQLGVKMQVIDR